jgi:hypothetical protein
MASTMSDYDIGPGLRDDPDVNPSSLRFGVGNLVIYKDEQRKGWHEGEVVKVAQRLELGNHSEFIHYIVWPNTEDVDGTVWVQGDTEDFIRPRPQDLTPDPTKFTPFFSHPEDPLSYLYTGLTNDPYTEDGENMAEHFERVDMVDDARINPDGSIGFNIGGRKMSATTVQIPDEVDGVHGEVAFRLAQNIHLRRDIHSKAGISAGMVDLVGIFKSAVPSESSLEELEAASRNSSDKMLLLADALMSGVHGWTRDPNRACACFRAAGMGCQEEDIDEVTGIAVGNPEAMVAYAYVILQYIQVKQMGLDLMDPVSYARILRFALRIPEGVGLIKQLLWWTSSSVKRGSLSPFALELARAIKEVDLQNNRQVDGETKDLIEPLIQAMKYREMEVEVEKLQQQGVIPRGNPSDSTIQLFRTKADEIFRSLPITNESIHIEYRQVPRAPFPTAVFALLPSKQTVLKTLRLPDAMSLSPFSQESFEFAWLRIAFQLHLGDLQGRQRTRPSTFTVHDSHGNREFASYLQNRLRGSGTQIRLISHDDPIQLSSGRRGRSRNLGEIIRKLEMPLLEVPGMLYDPDAADVVSEAQREFVQRSAQTLFASVGDDKDEIIRKATQLKTEGNNLFAAEDYTGATKCYSIAIQLLSHLVDPDNVTYKLIGTLLSNRAACYLELEERGTNPEFRRLLAQNAIKDCTLALESSWALDALPRSIRDKLEFRRDKATARHDALSTDFESVAPILFPDSGTNDELPIQHGEQEEQRPKRRRRRRRRQRRSGGRTHEQRSSIHESTQASVDDTDVQSTGQASSDERNYVELDSSSTTKPDELNLQQDNVIDATMEYGRVLHENSLAKNSNDGCPICLRDFSGELSHTYSVVLPCGEHAMCIECACRLKKQSDKAKTVTACPLCRSLFDQEFVEDLAGQVMDVDQELAMLIVKLPVGEAEDRVEVGRRLLWTNDFCVEKVIEALECMFDAQTSQSLFRTSIDLTHQEKQTVYDKARYPVVQLQEKLKRLLEEQRTTFETSRLNRLLSEIRQVRTDLAASRRQAREEIYTQLNSVGNMGAQLGSSDESGTIQIDFHGLHVSEMYQKFAEQVKPILPVVCKVVVITGRGLHSANGESKLKKSLMKRIEQHEPDIRYEKIPENPGALNVVWTPAST